MSDLPQGWVTVSLDECALFNPKHSPDIPRTLDVSFVPMAAVDDANGEMDAAQVRPLNEVWKGYTHFQTGDVVFAKITPCMENGKIAVARELVNDFACGTTEFHVLRPEHGVSADFLWRYLRQQSFRIDAERAMTGAVGQRRVPADFLRRTTVPLPPSAEQRRIVAKIDSLSAKSCRARDHLDHIPRLVEKYKQTILGAAFRGELTREWRRPTLAMNYVRIEDLVEGLDQGWSPKCEPGPARSHREWAVIKTTAIQPIQFDPTENKRLPDHLDPRLQLEIAPGDVLVTRAGPRSRVAVTCVVKETRPKLMLCDKAYRLRVKPGVADPSFIALMLNAPQSLDRLEIMKTGINDSGLNLTQTKFLQVPLPEFEFDEQRHIVGRVETTFTWIDRLAKEASSARKLIDNLDQAVLAKAFRGELVPQDPNDEPAIVLLDRIRTQRAAHPPGRRGRKAKVTANAE